MAKTNVTVNLIGVDGNAFNILGIVCRELRRAKCSKELIQEYQNEAMSGDYDHLLATTLEYVNIE